MLNVICVCRSQAEYLQSLAPQSNVVKAFNVLSAYALESGGIQGSKEVSKISRRNGLFFTNLRKYAQ